MQHASMNNNNLQNWNSKVVARSGIKYITKTIIPLGTISIKF